MRENLVCFCMECSARGPSGVCMLTASPLKQGMLRKVSSADLNRLEWSWSAKTGDRRSKQVYRNLADGHQAQSMEVLVLAFWSTQG